MVELSGQHTTTRTSGRRNPQTRGNNMSKIRLTKMAVAGVLVVATATPIAAQTVFANGNGNKHLSVFTGTSTLLPPPPPDTSRCGTPFNPANRPCVITTGTSGGRTWTGAFVGESTTGAAILAAVLVPVAPATQSIPYVLWGKPTGTVEGCGTGSFIIQMTGISGSGAGDWEIVKDSGTGALLTLRGSGTWTSVTAAGVATDTLTGRLRCGDKKYGRGNQDD
jgi:hypothetical protein